MRNFNAIITNPPYAGSLHLDIFNRLLDNLDGKTGQMTIVEPSTWLINVKKCLDGLHKGERDDSLNAACYAMDKNGYREHIREFLDEVFCERSIKEKFYRKFR